MENDYLYPDLCGGLDNSLPLAGEIWGMPAKSSKLEFQLSEDRL